jgi:hypothetical protein
VHTRAVPRRLYSDVDVICGSISIGIGSISSVGMKGVRRLCIMGFLVRRIARGMRLSIILGLFVRLWAVGGFLVGLII